jgi:GNAT superfamily N-acetyltransferase
LREVDEREHPRSGNPEQASTIRSDRDGPGYEMLPLQNNVQGWLLMDQRIRDYGPPDEEPVVELSLRAWAPVFNSLEQVLGREVFVRLHGDWRQHQEKAVRDTLTDIATQVWVAEAARGVVGFVAAKPHPERHIGEISMLAVDPDDQRRGIGTALTEFATGWLRDAGMSVAMVETGGDWGHAPARRVYEKADYTLLPVARYFKAL